MKISRFVMKFSLKYGLLPVNYKIQNTIARLQKLKHEYLSNSLSS